MQDQLMSLQLARFRAGLATRVSAWIVALSFTVLLAGLLRLVPHPPNFTPMAALALMSGIYLRSLKCALAIPIGVMLATDCAIGLHPTVPFVYGSFAMTVLIGRAIRRCPNLVSVVLAALSASLLFFVITNFGHWLIMGFYPRTLTGLFSSYGAALGLFGFTLAGDLIYSICFFGVLAGLRRSGQ